MSRAAAQLDGPQTSLAGSVLTWQPRVLVVDDDRICRIAAQGLLERLGLSVDVAVDGREAFEMAAAWHYVAIFMDCFMPEVDGYQAARQIRVQAGLRADPLVVAVTGHPRHVCIASGMDHHIAKPLRLERLRADCARLGLLAEDRPPAQARSQHEQLQLFAPNPSLPAARSARLCSTFLERALGDLPGLWRAANRGDVGALTAIAEDLAQRAANVGALALAGLCEHLLDEARRGRLAVAAALEAEVRLVLSRTADAVLVYATAPTSTPAPSPPRTAGRPTRPPASLLDTVRVAVVDDDALARLAIETIVRRGERLALVGSAADVDSVAALVQQQRPDVAVVDFLMPGGGGPEAARRIHERSPGTRVVALTASDSPSTYLAMLRAGADGLLVKGGSPQRLVSLIHRAVARAAA
ncbi:MAG: response regulator [Solirubrobacteraceae bacterium]